MMKNLFWLTLCFASTMLMAQKPSPNGVEPVVQKFEQFEGGKIDWTNHVIEVSGISILNYEKFKEPTQRLEMAKRGALLVAKANLLEMMQGIKIYRNTTVEDLMTTGDLVKGELEGVVKGARQVGEAKVEGDVVRVTVAMPFDAGSGLVPLLHEKIEQKKSRMSGGVSQGSQPEVSPQAEDRSGAELVDTAAEVVLNFKDNKFDPALFPVIVDEEGNIVIDYAEVYKKHGGELVKYVKVAETVAKDLNWQKGKEIIEAIQKPDGSIKVDTRKHPKLRKFLKHSWQVGKTVLPIVLGLL